MTEIYYTNNRRKRRVRRKRRRRLLSLCLLAVFLLLILTVLNVYLSPLTHIENIAPAREVPWNLILVNRDNPITEDYEPTLTQLSNGTSVDERIYPELQAMFDAARQEGYDPQVVSGYRTEAEQQQLLDEKIREFEAEGYGKSKAERLAAQWVALPGTSEHQLGLAVDINGSTYDIYYWLQENSYKYGFIYRYPADKTDITGIAHEEWHYRYVGVDAATDIYQQNICLEEYLKNR